MREKIMSMLSDMDDEQIKNVYDYVCDEYDEKNHEANRVELLKKQLFQWSSNKNGLRQLFFCAHITSYFITYCKSYEIR